MSSPIVAYPSGVWPDGTIPGEQPSRDEIAVYQGTDAAVQLTVRVGAGTILNLTGYTVRLYVTWSTTGITPTIAAPATGVALFALDTTAVEPGRYECQFEAISSTGIREMLTPRCALVVLPTVG